MQALISLIFFGLGAFFFYAGLQTFTHRDDIWLQYIRRIQRRGQRPKERDTLWEQAQTRWGIILVIFAGLWWIFLIFLLLTWFS